MPVLAALAVIRAMYAHQANPEDLIHAPEGEISKLNLQRATGEQRRDRITT